MTPLDSAITSAGGIQALASALHCSASAPSMWRKRGRIPAEYCPAIERLTRERAAIDPDRPIVTCEELRPDVAWDVLRLQATPDQRQSNRGPAARGQAKEA